MQGFISMQVYQVGGAVRDRLLGRPVSDIDWVVVGATPEHMLAQGFRPVGADFPVFLHPATGEEYALARCERKTGHGYGGFTFFADPSVTLEQDLLRRDLTINAMAQDEQGNLIDPYGGRQDLQNRVLRHVSPAFIEDPLRVLRVARFAARYADLGFVIADETLALMRELSESGELLHLSAERIWQEFARALMEPQPQVFIETLRIVGALAQLLPEVDALFGVPQRAEYHPEVDTGLHVLCVLEQAAHHGHNLSVRWSCLLHDLGKGRTNPSAWPRHIGHEARGVALIKAVNQRFKVAKELAEMALLVGEYHTHCHRALELRATTLLELLMRLDFMRRPQRVEDFVNACEMDSRGRYGFERRDYPQAQYVRDAAAQLRALSTEELIAHGLTGKALGNAIQQQRVQVLEAYKAAYATNR